MHQSRVTMNVRKAGGGAGVIDVQGELTAAAEKVLTDAYTEAAAGGARTIVLNFSDLEYMNSSGIGLLVTLLVRANRQGQRLLAGGLSEHYRHIFELTRLNEAIRVYDTAEAALRAANAA